ncbi:MAG: hypothetical protein LUH15_09385 [Tannerellaceae bacterium]|nr:hypothetical protein [Tannerellaceae bacterium]
MSEIKAELSIVPDNPGSTTPWVCPGFLTSYSLKNPDNYKILKIEYKLSNGSFEYENDKTTLEVFSANQPIYVYWRSASSTDSKAPSGTITAEVFFIDGLQTPIKKTYTQKIKSLKGYFPPLLTSDYGSNTISAPIGTQSFYVKLNSKFYYPSADITGSYPVQKFEWTLPEGWKDSHGNTGTFYTTGDYLLVTPDFATGGTIKVIGINDCNSTDVSNYSNLVINRPFKFTSSPSSISYGQQGNFTYTVSSISNADYIWDYPNDWTVVSGAGTNSITLRKPVCSTSVDVKVKVKSKTSPYPESGWIKAPTNFILPKIIAPTEIQQYHLVNIKIEFPLNTNAIVTLTNPSILIDSGDGTSNQIVSFYNNSSKKIEAKITIPGCEDKPLIISENLNIVPLYNFTITGSGNICTPEYKYYDIKEIVNVSFLKPIWTTSSNIIGSHALDRPFGAKAKSTTNSGEKGTITATITGISISKEVYIGIRYVERIEGPTITNLNQTYTYNCYPISNPEVYGYNYIWETQPQAGDHLTIDIGKYTNVAYIKYLKAGYFTILAYAKSDCEIQNFRTSIRVMAGLRYSVSTNKNNITIEKNDFLNDPYPEQNTTDFIIYDTKEKVVQKGEISYLEKSAKKQFSIKKKGKFTIKIKTPEGFEKHEIEL